MWLILKILISPKSENTKGWDLVFNESHVYPQKCLSWSIQNSFLWHTYHECEANAQLWLAMGGQSLDPIKAIITYWLMKPGSLEEDHSIPSYNKSFKKLPFPCKFLVKFWLGYDQGTVWSDTTRTTSLQPMRSAQGTVPSDDETFASKYFFRRVKCSGFEHRDVFCRIRHLISYNSMRTPNTSGWHISLDHYFYQMLQGYARTLGTKFFFLPVFQQSRGATMNGRMGNEKFAWR